MTIWGSRREMRHLVPPTFGYMERKEMSRIDLHLPRRDALAVIGASGILSMVGGEAYAEAAQRQSAFERAIEELRVAMVEGNEVALDKLLHAKLIYMHSSGHSQTKTNLMSDLAGKKFFASLTYSDVLIETVDRTGIVAMTIDQVKNLPGDKTRASRIKVMQTWVSAGNDWKLLARLSSIISSPLTACPPGSNSAPTQPTQ